MNTNKPVTDLRRRVGRLLAALALTAFGAALLPATATAAEFDTPSIYYTNMPRVHSVIVNKPISIAVKYKRVAGYLNQMRIYQDGFLLLATTDSMGNSDHGGSYFPTFADKTGWYWAWFGNITLTHTAPFPQAKETHNIYVETCYISPVSAPVCKKSGANEFVVRQEYPVEGREWSSRLDAGPREKSQKYALNVAKHVGGYYTNWSVYVKKYMPKDIPVENLTHVYHAFLGICHKATNTGVLATTCTNNGASDFEIEMSDPDADIKRRGFDVAEDRDVCPGTSPYCAWPNEREPFAGIYAEYYRMKQALKGRGKDVKILVSIGGYGMLSAPFSEMASTSTNRKIFVDSVTRFLTEYDVFDGVDIDWEFPATDADRQNFVDVMELLRTKLDGLKRITGKKYELTMAAGPNIRDHLLTLNMAGLNSYVNRVNLMTYDYYGAWNNTFGHHAALGSCTLNGGSYLQPNADFYATATINGAQWGTNNQSVINVNLDHGATPYIALSKLNLGVAAYGRAWKNVNGTGLFPVDSPNAVPVVATGVGPNSSSDFRHHVWDNGVISYRGIEKFLMLFGSGQTRYQALSGETVGPVFGSAGPSGPVLLSDTTCSKKTDYLWMWESGSTKGAFVTYDSPAAAKDKGSYIKSSTSLGGIFIWELAGDTGTLLNSIHEGLGSTKL
jgi:chitinase